MKEKTHISMACIICACIVAATGHTGWGWFLFVAVLAL